MSLFLMLYLFFISFSFVLSFRLIRDAHNNAYIYSEGGLFRKHRLTGIVEYRVTENHNWLLWTQPVPQTNWITHNKRKNG